MKSFAYSEEDFDSSLCYQIWYEIEGLRSYFRKFSRGREDEAMQLTLNHAMTHYRPNRGDLVPYLKTLAREILKDGNKYVPCDFMEETVADIKNEGCGTKVNSEGTKVSIGNADSTVKDVLSRLEDDTNYREKIAELALQFMNFFMLMCQSLINKDSTTIYFPKVYIRECLKLQSKTDTFNSECLLLYSEYKDEFDKFINWSLSNEGSWRETDFDLINKYGSKRIKMCTEDGSICKDPDKENWHLVGNLGNKRVIKIPYVDIYDYMCDLVDEDGINQMKFTIDDSFILRTLGGSLSVVNPCLFSEYDLIKSEILTNMLYDTQGRYIGVGSEYMYFIVDADKDYKIPHRRINGIDLDFEIIEVEV